MTQLDTDTSRIVQRLADIQARASDLNAEAEGLKAELRSLPPGDHTIDGKPVLRILANRRFDVEKAVGLLDAEAREKCLSVVYDAAELKRHLTLVEIDECMGEAGKPRVVLL